MINHQLDITTSYICLGNSVNYGRYFFRTLYIYIYIYIRGAYDKFPDFFRMGTFIESTHVKL